MAGIKHGLACNIAAKDPTRILSLAFLHSWACPGWHVRTRMDHHCTTHTRRFTVEFCQFLIVPPHKAGVQSLTSWLVCYSTTCPVWFFHSFLHVLAYSISGSVAACMLKVKLLVEGRDLE